MRRFFRWSLITTLVVVSVASHIRAQSPGPVAAYAFSEGSGTSTVDGSGGGHTGALQNDPTWTTQGRFGSALVFDGNNARAAVADSDALDVTSAFTLEGWVYPTTATPYGMLMAKEGIGGHVYRLGVTNGGRGTVLFATASGAHYLLGDAVVTANQWTHVAATYDGSKVRIYLNGMLDISYNVTGAAVASASPLSIGKGAPGTGFTGRLDELRVYAVKCTGNVGERFV